VSAFAREFRALAIQFITGIHAEADRPDVLPSPLTWALSMLIAVPLRESPPPNERRLESLYPVLQLHVSYYAVPAVVGRPSIAQTYN